MSGKAGDAATWRWARELVLDAVDADPCHLLDVGCASGHLMACFEQWGAERGQRIVAYGLEISDRLARVARALLDRVRRDFLRPGGRVVLRAERVHSDQPDVVDTLRALGIEPDGVIEAVHPTRGAVRRTAWLAR
ncbi:MAG: hypothetical protein R3F59_30735 [Myxococcota bacterium]